MKHFRCDSIKLKSAIIQQTDWSTGTSCNLLVISYILNKVWQCGNQLEINYAALHQSDGHTGNFYFVPQNCALFQINNHGLMGRGYRSAGCIIVFIIYFT